MAFLPIIVGAAGAAGGFIAGYMYQPASTGTEDFDDQVVAIPDLKDEIDKIKSIAPRKDLNDELTKFDKSTLKKSQKLERQPTSEQMIMKNLAEKISQYRKYVETEQES